MKILIITQVVDQNHPVLGFFVRWIEEFAIQCGQVTVICLEKGEFKFPDNVQVLSLGKEKGSGRLNHLCLFYRFIWSYRKEYDSVFVHMNQLYVLLGGFLWRLFNKKIGLWYTHGTVSSSLRIAIFFVDHILTASSESFKLSTVKKIVTGHGIDTETFKPLSVKKQINLVTVGRISNSKNIESLIDIVHEVRKKYDIDLNIIGGPVTDVDAEHLCHIEEKVKSFNLQNYINFRGPVKHAELPLLLNKSKIFVTTANNGSLDKVMLEAMACGLPVVSMAEGSRSLPLGQDQVFKKSTFIKRLNLLLGANTFEARQSYVEHVAEFHGLQTLVSKIKGVLSHKV